MIKEEFIPGTMITDREPHLLKENEWQSVVNYRLRRLGVFENIEKLRASFTGTDIRSVSDEITDDASGARFILFQDGHDVKRVDYNITTSPLDGYANETPYAINANTDITFGGGTRGHGLAALEAGDILEFTVYRGVIRVTGGDTSYWYGYIDRKIMENAWELLDQDTFESTVEGWAGTATISLATPGTHMPDGAKCLSVFSDAAPGYGYARKQVTVETGRKVKIRMAVRREETVATGLFSGDIRIRIGSTAGGAEYQEITSSLVGRVNGNQTGVNTINIDIAAYGAIKVGGWINISGNYRQVTDHNPLGGDITIAGAPIDVMDNDPIWPDWTHIESSELTMTGTTLHIEILPAVGGANAQLYVDAVYVFQDASVTIQGWTWEKTDLDELELRQPSTLYHLFNDYQSSYGDAFASGDEVFVFLRTSAIYDQGQYSLLKQVVSPASYPSGVYLLPSGQTGMGDAGLAYAVNRRNVLQLKGTDLKNNWPNNRLTGFFFVAGSEPVATPKTDEDQITFYVQQRIDFEDLPTTYKYPKYDTDHKFKWDPAYPMRLWLSSTADPTWLPVTGDNFLVSRRLIKFYNYETGALLGQAHIIGYGFELNYPGLGLSSTYIQLDQPISAFCEELGSTMTDQYVNFIVEVEQKVEYFPGTDEGYYFQIFWPVLETIGGEFYALSEIPAGTKSLTCKHDTIAFAGERSWITSKEDGEGDMLRYSPEYQPDSHPESLVAPNLVGDGDSNRWVINLGDRIVALKRNSISQFQMDGDAFSQDIGLFQRGLYPRKGWKVLDSFLVFMDVDDAYIFASGIPEPLISKAGLAKYYKEYVNEASFMLYDRYRQELWFVLDGAHIIVWQRQYDSWYTRESALTMLGGAQKYDGSPFLFIQGGVYWPYSRTDTSSEYQRLELVGRELGRFNMDKFKKLYNARISGATNAMVSQYMHFFAAVCDGVQKKFTPFTLEDHNVTENTEFDSPGFDGWAGTNATLSQDTVGIMDRKSLKILTSGSAGYASRTFTLGAGLEFRFSMVVKTGASPAAGFSVKVGTPTDDDYHGSWTADSTGSWKRIEVAGIVQTAGDVVIKVTPGTASGSTAWLDFVQIQVHELTPGYVNLNVFNVFKTMYPRIISSSDSKSVRAEITGLTIEMAEWNAGGR